MIFVRTGLVVISYNPYLSILSESQDVRKVKEEAKLEALRIFAEALGIEPMRVRIEKEKELGRDVTGNEEIELIKLEIKKLREPQDDPQLVVREEELGSYLKDGWQFVSVLPLQKILIRK